MKPIRFNYDIGEGEQQITLKEPVMFSYQQPHYDVLANGKFVGSIYKIDGEWFNDHPSLVLYKSQNEFKISPELAMVLGRKIDFKLTYNKQFGISGPRSADS